ncbi:MAG TPA: AAA family ATPase, partial [Polyangiaceae bacterium]|nr:AAA family ATPase [Polyangiaceae bacterium]
MSEMDIPVRERPEEAETPLFGREKAAESLNAAFVATMDSGQFHAVTLVGTAGQGKTALIGQILARTRRAAKDQPLILSVRARHPGVSYGLFSRLLRERFDVPETLAEAEATRKVETEVRRVLGVENVTDVCFFLGQLMRLSFEESPLTVAATAEPGQSQLMHRGVMRRFLEADSARRAICLVFDDVHRADADSLDLLQSLLANLDGRILVVCAAERELLAKRENWLGSVPGRHS